MESRLGIALRPRVVRRALLYGLVVGSILILINHGDAPFTVERGMRIAQMVIAPVTRAEMLAVDSLEETQRGSGGFGSTGA